MTDGLSGLDGCGITDIAICGMGGELIADILSAAPFVKDKGIRLILQPMTRAAHLRRFLAREGFAVIDECVTEAAGKCYFCLCAEYTGESYTLSRPEAELGQKNIQRIGSDACFLALLEDKLRASKKRLLGYERAGRSDADEEAYFSALMALKEISL